MKLPTPALFVTALLLLTACGTSSGTSTVTTGSDADAVSGNWPSVLKAARGQTVNWYMYGGDEALNTFVSGTLAARLKPYGVSVNQVKITDTVNAINKVLAEKQAGKTDGGSVDLIWVNGENFATGKQAGLWQCGYDLPNAKYVDATNPAVTSDFGVPVDGCESVWQQANSALVYDSSKLAASDVTSVSTLFSWANAHPGRFTYPAPPDFTGSMAVRTFLYDTAGGPTAFSGPTVAAAYGPASTRLWQRLLTVAPSLWRKGKTYPVSQADVEKLYGQGEIDAYLTYGPGAVAQQVSKGVFPSSTREAVFRSGNIANDSFVAIPANAAHQPAALVLANQLLDPATQLALFKADGAYPAIDLTRLTVTERQQFEAVDLGPSVLPLSELTSHVQPELATAYVTRLEADWKTHVLQR